MKINRRDFLKITGFSGVGALSAGILQKSVFASYSKRENTNVTVDYVVTTLEDGSTLSIPFWRVDSGNDGPSLLLAAAQHGNEIQGAEVARRFQEVCAKQLHTGSVWIIPMTNLQAIRARRHSIDLGPEQPGTLSEGHNMQQTWPGDPKGNDTERVSYELDQAVLQYCSHGVDMHCWNHFWAAETLAVTDHKLSKPLGEVTKTRFVSYRNLRPPQEEIRSFSQLIRRRGGGAVVIELSGQYQMQERQVQIGLSSMVNIAKRLGMFEGEPELIDGPKVIRNPDTSYEIFAPSPGIFMPAGKIGKTETLTHDDYVEEGQLLGHIISESDLKTISVYASVSGYLWQFGTCHSGCDASLAAQHPYVKEGDRVAIIVTV